VPEPVATVRRHVVVTGRVQGVSYRVACARQAAVAGVTGWVRNRADGSVEAVFEGEAAAVERMVEWCRQGPPRARVVQVQVVEQSPAGHPDFEIR
jgi:acylphosphatase